MASTTVVLPFALPPAELAAELQRNLQAPALATLLTRNKLRQRRAADSDSRVLPHEAWLASHLGANAGGAPLAAAAMAGFGLPPQAGHWFIVHPVHIQLARNHLVLADPRRLRLEEADARALFDTAQPYFDQLLWGDANTWFMRADDWQALDTASPDAAMGVNLADWMPTGPKALAFKKLQNEIQMLWHEHPANEARQARGLPPVNSFWMWGGAPAMAAPAPALAVAGGPAWLQALAAPQARTADHQQAVTAGGAVLLPHLIPAGAGNDWSAWLAGMQQLEQDWFAPLLAAVRSGAVEELTLVLTDREGWTEFRITKPALRKFWRTPNLKNLTQ